MENKVKVVVTGVHLRGNEEPEQIVTKSLALWEDLENGAIRLTCDPIKDDAGEEILSKYVFYDSKIKSIRSGLCSSIMIFEKDKPYTTTYTTPYGKMDMDIKTTALKIRKAEDRNLIAEIGYELFSKGDLVSKTEIMIEVSAC